MPDFPKPHYAKLQACLHNERLPDEDKERVEEAIKQYHQWMNDLENVAGDQHDTVDRLVDVTNRYKRFIELDLIFDSPGDFLYRQRGQLKLDNTILEEFLPQLVYRSLQGLEETFVLGARATFAGLAFLSSIGNPGTGGDPLTRIKDQDFTIGKPLFIQTSFERNFQHSNFIESYLGYVCAECKTNLDKTMFQEAVATSRDLKIVVPGSLYFLICEFLDMTPISITSTQIDDVLIVRKARRIPANVRQSYNSPIARKKHRQQYAEFIDTYKYHADVFQRMVNKIQHLIRASDPDPNKVLAQGHF
jgi:hypothetical protein